MKEEAERTGSPAWPRWELFHLGCDRTGEVTAGQRSHLGSHSLSGEQAVGSVPGAGVGHPGHSKVPRASTASCPPLLPIRDKH